MHMHSILGLVIIAGIVGVVVVGVVLAVVFGTRRSGASQSDNPNLRPCPDCGHYISVRATTCPHCGGPVKAG
jgi:ribosomal protein L32